MSAVQKVQEAIERGIHLKPEVGGFPYLAKAIAEAGVLYNHWYLPGCSSVYLLDDGTAVVFQGTPLLNGMQEISAFNKEALIVALRIDQAGNSTFAEFLQSAWSAGVLSYTVDFTKRTVSYFGSRGESYIEEYPEVRL